MSTSRIGGGLILAGVAFNLGCHLAGRRTICTAAREHLHLETVAGQVVTVAGLAVATVGFALHLLDPAKRPVRALARLAELVDDARVEF